MPVPPDDWFVREILVHEPALMAYLRHVRLRGEDVADLRQEVYVRVYEAAARGLPRQPRAFLLATARHLVIDRARRARVVSIEAMGDIESLNVLIDEVSPERWSGGRERLGRLAAAFAALPPRCRAVAWMRRVDDLPQKEVAVRLGISEKSVEKHLARAMRLLAGLVHGMEAGDAPVVRRRGRARHAAG
jgi:RNA polymerase sigma factor (sigma-70 family)